MKIICGYNVNLDAVHTLSGDEASHLIEETGVHLDAGFPGKICSMKDLLSGLLFCMKTGSGAELLIEDAEAAEQICKLFSWEYRLGGNAGNMANVLADLKAEPILNVPALTPKAAAFLHQSVRIPKDGVLRSPMDAATDGKDLTHFVFQFQAGTEVNAPGGVAVTPRENRFIASFDSLNRRLYTDVGFDAYCREHLDDVDGAIVAGFHLVSHAEFREVMPEKMEQIRSWKEDRSELYVHAEMGSFQTPEMMVYLLEHLAADSIGMNEDELLQGFPGRFDLSRRGLLQAAAKLQSHYGLKRVCIHTRDFVVASIGEFMEPQEEIEAIERGTEVAAALAATGSVTGKLTAPQISSGGASAVDDFCRDGAKRCGCGAFISQGGGFLCLVPSIDVSNPKVVVGLGDSMTAATFFCELALRR